MEQEKTTQNEMPVILATKYSKRVILKDIVGRSDGGVSLVGQRVVIGGWVKSSREVKKEAPPPPPGQLPPVQPTNVVSPKGISCVEIFQSRIPFVRSIIKVLGVGDYRVREKLDSVVNKPPQPSIAFLQVNDGSCASSLQVTVESSLAPPIQLMPTGTCVMAEGVLQHSTIKGKHVIELKVDELLHIGTVDQEKYPLSKKGLPLEILRDFSHFRPRTTTVASVTRIHSAFNQATHAFFQNHGFIFVQVPIITCTDSEGFSKKFQVTTLINKEAKKDSKADDNTEGVNLEAIKASIRDKTYKVEELKRSESNKEALVAAVQDLKKTTDLVTQLESRQKRKSGNVGKAEKVKFSEDFFHRKTYLTVSGHLHLESYACSLGNVYTLGPRFCADRLNSKKSLAEMWMVELEMAFSEQQDAMDCGAEFLKFTCKWILENCSEDLNFVSKRIDKTVAVRLHSVVSSSFEKITYAEAVEILKQVTSKKFEGKGEHGVSSVEGKKPETRVEYGVPLTEEHESFLADEIFKKPVFIYNYPKELKPFYVRVNDDGKTVAAFDLIVPKVGKLIQGSQKEERLNILVTRIKELGLATEEYEWYLDLRRHGTVNHSGLSLSMERLVLLATGLNDIKEVVPFPRSYGKANN